MRPQSTPSLPGASPGKRPGIKKRYASLFFPASLALIFVMACGPLRTLEHAPASIIYLIIRIQNQYTTTAQVTLSATFSDGNGAFALSGDQALTCDGVILPQGSQGVGSILLNRQPPGGSYHCIYTDDQGKTSPVTVPVPPGNLAITSPAPNTAVPIPVSAQSPTPEGSPTPLFRTLESTDPLTIDYTVPTLPADVTVNLSVNAQCGSAAAPDACGIVTGCAVSDARELASGSCTLSDANTPYTYGFARFSPGPGSIGLVSDFKWTAPAAVFQELRVEYADRLNMPIIWVTGSSA
jgi:hypothetical protein